LVAEGFKTLISFWERDTGRPGARGGRGGGFSK